MMRFTPFAIACFAVTTATAQNWSVSQLSAGFGTSTHHVNQRASERLFSLAPASVIPSQNLTGYSASHTAHETSSFTSIQVHFTQDERAKYDLEREVRFGLLIHLGRKGGAKYEQQTPTDQGVLIEQWIAHLLEDELGLNADFLWRKHFDAFSFYSGIGGNMGIALGGEVQQTRLVYYKDDPFVTNELFSNLNTTFPTGNSYYFRATIPIGVEYSFGQFDVGAEYGVGATFNKAGSHSNLFTSNVSSLRFGMELGG